MIKQIFLFFPLFLIGCNTNQKSIENRILAEISNTKELNFSHYNDFEWDSLIILRPYSNIQLIEKEYNIDLSGVSESIEILDTINLIVFLNNNKATKYAELTRDQGDFSATIIIKKENANFRLSNNNTFVIKIKPAHHIKRGISSKKIEVTVR